MYVIEGELLFVVGDRQFPASAGESVFVPRQTTRAWGSAAGRPARILDVYQPAGQMEEFFRAVGKYSGGIPIHEALSFDELKSLFRKHGMEMVGPGGRRRKLEGGRWTNRARLAASNAAVRKT